MKLLITGGAGYIGSGLITELNYNDVVEEVVVYDNLSKGELNFFFGNSILKKTRFVKGDIFDTYKLQQELKRVDGVLHLAAFVSHPFNHLQNLQYEQVNRWGTLGLVRCIERADNVKRFCYMSSAAVFGFREDIKAEDTPHPENAYGLSKWNGEQYASLLADKCEVSIIRSGNVFGFNPCMGLDGVINVFFFDALVKGEITIFGNGEQKRPFVSLNKLNEIINYWVGGKQFENYLAVEFNSSMNQIKDWLLEHYPTLSYQYLNQNQVFPSQSFQLDQTLDLNTAFGSAFEQFKQSIRILK